MDFTVPIQRSTEREIFDYIDLESIKKLLSDNGGMATEDYERIKKFNNWIKSFDKKSQE